VKPVAASRWWPRRCNDWPNVLPDATRQISALVKAIQTDTQDAVAAMERSTQGVVEGSKLSDQCGYRADGNDQVFTPAGRADRTDFPLQPPGGQSGHRGGRTTSSTFFAVTENNR